MLTEELLKQDITNRIRELEKAKDEGYKIVGYTPGGFFPEELALACGAIPVGLIRGGEQWPIEFSSEYICRWIDPFCRAQIGYAISGNDQLYNLLDLLVIPITDNHIRAVFDILSYETNIPIFLFGVPHTKDKIAFDYYLNEITRLKERLENLTGVTINTTNLKRAIDLCNLERQLFREISLTRKEAAPKIDSREFVALNHASCLLDKTHMINVLESVRSELITLPQGKNGPRLMLTGSTLAHHDDMLFKMVEDVGGCIVIEEFAECLKSYWYDVENEGDLIASIADMYFMRRQPPAWFRPYHERFNFLAKLAMEFDVAGIIWYQLMYRESYKLESYFFRDYLTKNHDLNLPMLVLESEYDSSAEATMKTRVETFIEGIMLNGDTND